MIVELFPLILALMALGALAGFLAGLLGVGGGGVMVPGLYFIFSAHGYDGPWLMHICVATSLAAIVVTGGAASFAHARRGSVDWLLARRIGGGIVAGSVMASFMAERLSGLFLTGFFSSVLFVLAMIMFGDPKRYRLLKAEPGQPWSGLVGALMGGVSVLAGIGGGSLSISYMSICSVPIHRAVGTASVLGVVIAVPAALIYVLTGWDEAGRLPFSLGFVNVFAWAVMVPFGFGFAPLGARLAHRLPVAVLRRVFAVFLLFVSLKMGWNA